MKDIKIENQEDNTCGNCGECLCLSCAWRENVRCDKCSHCYNNATKKCEEFLYVEW